MVRFWVLQNPLKNRTEPNLTIPSIKRWPIQRAAFSIAYIYASPLSQTESAAGIAALDE
jgi:hypothetical protein